MNLTQISFKGDELLKCLLSVTTECFAVLDRQGVFLETNETFSRLIECDRDVLKGTSLFDLEPQDGEGLLRKSWASLLEKNPYELEFPIQDKAGAQLILEGNFYTHQTDAGSLVCLFCKEKRFDPEKLKLLKLQTEALSSTANAVVITDADGGIVWANRAFSKYTGYSLSDAEGKQPGELLKSGKHPAAFYREMWETIRRGEIWKGEIINRRKDGTLYPEEMTITPLFTPEGEISHYIAVKQDVSEKKNLQEMFLRSQRLESVGTLASGVAHDLNNVLSPIVMSADLLMVQSENAHIREMLQMIKESAKRGADIIRQLLTFVRGDDDELVELQVRHILKDLVKVFRETFPRYISIEDRISTDLLPVKGNATNLHQVFTNLMINARDAMADGGNLLIRVENITLDQDNANKIPKAYPGAFVRVRIQDEGTGIAPEHQEQIFKSFFTTKAEGKGTGLGLSTVLSIVKKHKGFLSLDSKVGVGTTFDVYLPVFDGALSPEQKAQKDEVPYGYGEHLLVIDDEESIGYMLKGTLKTLNYNVKITSGGEEGLAWWLENRDQCDLILLDMMMPGMDGADVYQKLKENNCEAEILIMSGMVSEEKLSETEVDLKKSFIPKPFTIIALAKKLRELLDS